MTLHHPGDDLLLAWVSGSLRAAQARVLTVHVDGCMRCRSHCVGLRTLGGVLLDEIEPAAVDQGAWARTLARIESEAASPGTPPIAPRGDAPTNASPLPLPVGLTWPRALAGCTSSRWRWMGPGMRFARLHAPEDPTASLVLLRIGEGRSLPRHTHGGTEWTQVLCGAFDDGRARFAAGDFDEADTQVHHQPVVRAGSECICLAWLDAPLRFEGRVAAMVGGWVGL